MKLVPVIMDSEHRIVLPEELLKQAEIQPSDLLIAAMVRPGCIVIVKS